MILMFLDGVLRTTNDAPIYESIAILSAVKDSKKVTVLAKDRADADRWLKSTGVGKIDNIVDHSHVTATEDKDFWMVEYCRAQGKITMVFTSDTVLAEKLLENGVTTMLLLHPMYIRPEFRPDGRGRKSWEAIVEEIDKQQEMYAEDERLR